MIVFLLYALILIITFLILGSYLLYPLLLYILPEKKWTPFTFPKSTVVHLIIPCYNEEKVLRKKIENAISIAYPFPLKVHIVIDQSTDRTYEIAEELAESFSQVTVWNKGYRQGKNDSINYVIQRIKPHEHDILLFTDSNTFFEKQSFNALYEEFKKGSVVVGGSMVYKGSKTRSAQSECLYWKYEEWIRENESKSGRLIAMNGGIIAVIAKYFEPVPDHVSNDFEAPLRLVSKYRSTFAKEAKGIEDAIQDGKEEYSRKQRMANRQMNAVFFLWKRMSTMTKFQVTFHKVIRWFGMHLFMLQCGLIFLLCSLQPDRWSLFLGLFHASMLLLMAISLARKEEKGNRLFSVIYHAMAVHNDAFKGACGAIFKKKTNTWDKAESNR